MSQHLTFQRLIEIAADVPLGTKIVFPVVGGVSPYLDSDVLRFPTDVNGPAFIVLTPGQEFSAPKALRRLGQDRERVGLFVVCEVICQKPSVSVHFTEAAALQHAVQCAMENLRNPDVPELDARAEFEVTLTDYDRITEGDYEVHILTPTN